MTDAPTHKAFFGDGEKSFALDPALIMELERKTGAGIGSISRRLFDADFRFVELVETIRLGLIGGGMEPDDATALVDLYAPRMSVTKLYEIAAALIELVMFGAPKIAEPEHDAAPANETEAAK